MVEMRGGGRQQRERHRGRLVEILGPSVGASGIFGSSVLTNALEHARAGARSASMSPPRRISVSVEKTPAISAAAITRRPTGYHSVPSAVVRLSEAR